MGLSQLEMFAIDKFALVIADPARLISSRSPRSAGFGWKESVVTLTEIAARLIF